MKKPSPELLDVFYRACAFPIDDLDVGAAVKHTSSVYASAWLVPTRTIPAIFFIMGGGSGDLSALLYELRRLAEMTAITATALNYKVENRTLTRPLCYHYFVQVTHLDSRVHSKSIEPWDDALTPLLHTSPLHPFFEPLEEYAHIYEVGYIESKNLPHSSLTDADTDFIGDPDEPVAKRFSPAFDDDDDLSDDDLNALNMRDDL